VDKGYELYCLANPTFYDSALAAPDEDAGFASADRPPPAGWLHGSLDDWVFYGPPDVRLPLQGWKIHASACLDNAEQILAVIRDYCVENAIAFKHLRSRRMLFLRNMKYANRGFSGKFVTIFPVDEQQLETILSELGGALEGQASPYILSDLRWGSGPLYVRYGGFAERYCVGRHGELEPAIDDGTGRLVPDRRAAVFSLPEGVPLPACLNPHLEARNAQTLDDLPYRIDRALHFSNGGGVYAGVDTRTGEEIVLKEARAHAGLAIDEADAVTRLHHEREVLQRLAGLGVVPAVRDHFARGDHHFLVMDYVQGASLNTVLVERSPLLFHGAGDAAMEEFATWAVDICAKLERCVDAVHERGIVIGDLHPSNVLATPDGEVVLIDLEVASDVAEGRRQSLADPGFMAPAGERGFAIDRYALACIQLHLFLPLTTLFRFDPAKVAQLADEIADLFDLPEDVLAGAVRVITDAHARAAVTRPDLASSRRPRLRPDRAGWQRARASMAEAILASATPERDDRLFPGDPKQFTTGGLNLAYGAAGVLYALHATGAGRHRGHEDWLVRRATNPLPGTRLGFYDGLHGIAYALHSIGRPDEALEVLDICERELDGKLEHLGLDLYTGLAGIGLNLAHFATATGNSRLWDGAEDVAAIVADRLGDEHDVATLSGGDHPHAGLLRGSSGPALLFLRLHAHTGDPALLDLAATALRQDLRRCILHSDGTLNVNEGWRLMPYLADGSVGIGMVLAEYLRQRPDEEFADAAAAIHKAAEGKFYIEPGLFWGRSGMLVYLCRGRDPGTAAEDPVVSAHVRRLAWHALAYRGNLAFPGEQLLRLSMDLATGTAGVLLALGAVQDPRAQLPLFTRSPERALHEEVTHDSAVP
jgi:tRNA A-37 threonylcarbamoyl transferase component Bud32